MRYVSILAIGMALAGGLGAFPLSLAHAAEDGVSCEKHQDQGWIDCTVKRDTFSVGSVTLNAGACPAPILSDQDTELARHFNNRLKAGDRKLTKHVPPMMNIPSYFSALCVPRSAGSFSGDPKDECPAFLAWLKTENNPVGNYKSADQFRVVTFGCDDVVEMTIRSDDGETSTWNFAGGN